MLFLYLVLMSVIPFANGDYSGEVARCWSGGQPVQDQGELLNDQRQHGPRVAQPGADRRQAAPLPLLPVRGHPLQVHDPLPGLPLREGDLQRGNEGAQCPHGPDVRHGLWKAKKFLNLKCWFNKQFDCFFKK